MNKPIQVCILPNIKGYELRKRVYSVEGVAPTIRPCGGGNNEPKIIVPVSDTLLIRDGGK
jgi:hypothetical protein